MYASLEILAILYLYNLRVMQEDTAYVYKITFYQKFEMEQKGMTFDHDFYVFVGKQCRT
jgi:hypothetical protein